MNIVSAAVIGASIILAVLLGVWLNSYLSPQEKCVRDYIRRNPDAIASFAREGKSAEQFYRETFCANFSRP